MRGWIDWADMIAGEEVGDRTNIPLHYPMARSLLLIIALANGMGASALPFDRLQHTPSHHSSKSRTAKGLSRYHPSSSITNDGIPTDCLLGLRGGAENHGNEGEDNVNEDDDWRRDLPPSPYTYTPPSALDSYGGSPQIRNAAQAATGRYGGTIVLAAVATGSGEDNDDDGDNNNNAASVVCCSLRRVRKGVRSSRQCQPGTSAGEGGGGGITVHVVSCADPVPGASGTFSTTKTANDDDDDNVTSTTNKNAIVALAASGFRPDLDLLLTLLRSRSVDVWDRYDVPPGPGDMAESISQAFLTFLGYDRDREAGDGVGPVGSRSSRDEEGFSMSRPFGLDVLVFGVGWNASGGSNHGSDVNGASIISVGPSGMARGPFVARAAGRGSERANELLREQWRVGLDVTKVRQMCIDIIKEVSKEEMGIATDDVDVRTSNAEGWEIVCEMLSSKDGLISIREPLVHVSGVSATS